MDIVKAFGPQKNTEQQWAFSEKPLLISAESTGRTVVQSSVAAIIPYVMRRGLLHCTREEEIENCNQIIRNCIFLSCIVSELSSQVGMTAESE